MASLYFPVWLFMLFFLSSQFPFLSSSHTDEEADYDLPNCPAVSASSYQCGDLNVSPLMYPFTSSTNPHQYCGGLQLDCDNNNITRVSMHGDPYNKLIKFQVLRFYENNRTIVLNGTDLPRSKFCDSSRYISLFSTLSFSFTILDGTAQIRCPYTVIKDTFIKDITPNKSCSDGINVYNSEDFSHTQVIPKDCSVLPIREFSLKYQFDGSCKKCDGEWCGSNRDDFCAAAQNDKKNEKNKLIIILGSVSAAVVLLAIILIAVWRHRRTKEDSYSTKPRTLDSAQSDLETGSVFFGVPVFSYEDLKEATDNFNTTKELGEGGFGTVYYGELKDGRQVAVKRLYEKNYKQIEQFMNEIRILTCLHHKNLVTLYGCTSRHSRELLLVYEYVPKGTLADHLHGNQSHTKSLTWPIRMRIAIETASALSYLHATDIIHRDVKTNNILLDNDFTVKVADFGLSRLFPPDATHVSTAPQGTPGYVDPEYHQCYHLTDKSDVYSFGVVLVELISSLPAVDIDRHRHEINLSTYAVNRIQSGAFHELVDHSLGFDTDFKVKSMTMLVAELAFRCLQHEREIRPSMEEVLETLKGIQTADYDDTGALKEVVGMMLSRSNSTTKQLAPSPSENDDTGLLKNVQHPPPSPHSVMDEWMSKSTTPNTSAKEFCS